MIQAAADAQINMANARVGPSLARLAFILSVVSVALSLIACLGGIAVAVLTSSSSALGFALENGVDGFSSTLVMWRFWGGGHTVPEAKLAEREKRASVGIAIAFVVLAILVSSTAAANLAASKEVASEGLLIALAAPSFLVFLALAALKWRVGILAASAALKKDAACSFCGALLSLGVLVGIAAAEVNRNLWCVDAAIAVLVSLSLLLCGLYTLAKNAVREHAWWRPSWWRAVSAPSRAADDAPKAATLSSPAAKSRTPAAGRTSATTPSTTSSPESNSPEATEQV